MTIEKLKQYRFFRKRVKDLNYILISCFDEKRHREILSEKQRYEDSIWDIDEFIHGIDDAIIKRAIEIKYIEGNTKPSWKKVANGIGGNNSADNIRMAVRRYLEKM